MRDERLGKLCHHWSKAGDSPAAVEKAVNYLKIAGDKALDNFSRDEARQLFSQVRSPAGVETAATALVPRFTLRPSSEGVGHRDESREEARGPAAAEPKACRLTRGEDAKELQAGGGRTHRGAVRPATTPHGAVLFLERGDAVDACRAAGGWGPALWPVPLPPVCLPHARVQ